MILRMDKLPIELPEPKNPSPNSAAAVQELMGGQFGEMSTLMNYTFQSFNFRGRDKLRPFYDIIANIATEEYSHIELVAYTINLLLNGATKRVDDPAAAPLAGAVNARNSYHFLASGQQALPVDSMGNPWTGANVFSSGNLKLDLIHNFFLECGARAGKSRVYEMVDDPTARTLCAWLLVRGGTHIVAYARALEKLSGVDLTKLFPIPDVPDKKFPEVARLNQQGVNHVMYRFSPSDYKEINKIWNGPHPEDGQPLRVEDTLPAGFAPPNLPEEPQLSAPGVDPAMVQDIAKRLFGTAARATP